MAIQGNVRFQGVAVGTFARNLIYKHIKEVYDYNDMGFYNDLNNIREAYLIGKELVDNNTNKGESYRENTNIRN